MIGNRITANGLLGPCVVRAGVYDFAGLLVGVIYESLREEGRRAFSFIGSIPSCTDQLQLLQVDHYFVGNLHIYYEGTYSRILCNIYAANSTETAVYVDFDQLLNAENPADYCSFTNVTTPLNYQPYRLGTIAIDTSNIKRLASNFQLCSGKILDIRPLSRGEYNYSFQSIADGVVQRRHSQLIPADDYFDKATQDVYVSSVDCNRLFSKDERFLLRNAYLHNRNSTVMLDFKKYSKHFIKQEDVTAKTPTSKN